VSHIPAIFGAAILTLVLPHLHSASATPGELNCSIKYQRLTKAQERDTSHLSIISVHGENEFSEEIEEIKIADSLAIYTHISAPSSTSFPNTVRHSLIARFIHREAKSVLDLLVNRDDLLNEYRWLAGSQKLEVLDRWKYRVLSNVESCKRVV
jgi:hypothetical protein